MIRWLFLLGGLLIWAAHFAGVYAIASVADVVASADVPAARLMAGGLTAACAAADAALLWLCAALARTPRARQDALTGFMVSVAGLGALLSLAAVVWQGLPALIGY